MLLHLPLACRHPRLCLSGTNQHSYHTFVLSILLDAFCPKSHLHSELCCTMAADIPQDNPDAIAKDVGSHYYQS